VDGATCETPYNLYTTSGALELAPHGKRIDYVLFTSKLHVDANVTSCVVLRENVEGTKIPLSDHQAIEAEFNVQKLDLVRIGSRSEWSNDGSNEERDNSLKEAIQQIQDGESRVVTDRRLFLGSVVGLLVIIFYTVDLELTRPGLAPLAMPARFLVTLIVGFCLWYGVIGLTLEEKALKAAKAGMQLILAASGGSSPSSAKRSIEL